MNPVPKSSTIPGIGGLPPPAVLGLLVSLMLGPRAIPIPMNDKRSSSPGNADSGNWEISRGEGTSLLLVTPDPLEVDGRPSAADAPTGVDSTGGVHSPAGLPIPGSRDGASGEKLKLKLRLSGGGTLARVNLA